MKKTTTGFTLILLFCFPLAVLAQNPSINTQDAEILKKEAKEKMQNALAQASSLFSEEGEDRKAIRNSILRFFTKEALLENDLDPTKTTPKEFDVETYLSNMTAFYPDGANYEVKITNVSDVFYDAQGNYFVKIEAERFLEGDYNNGGKSLPYKGTEKLDFYLKVFENGKVTTQFPVYGMTKHQSSSYKKVDVIDGTTNTFINSDEVATISRNVESQISELQKEIENLRAAKEKAEQEAAEKTEQLAKAASEMEQLKKDREATDINNKQQMAKLDEEIRLKTQEVKKIEDEMANNMAQITVVAQKVDKDWAAWKRDSWSVKGKLHRISKKNLDFFNERAIKSIALIERVKDKNSDFVGLESKMLRIKDEIGKTLNSPKKLKLAKFYNNIVQNNSRIVLKASYGVASPVDKLDGEASITSINAHLGYRFMGKGRKRGHTFGVFGSFGDVASTTLSGMLNETDRNKYTLKEQKYNFVEGGLGFMFWECLRVSGGFGQQNITDNKGLSQKLDYMSVTSGISISHRRFLELDIFGKTVFGEQLKPTFMVGISAGIVLRTINNKTGRNKYKLPSASGR